MTKEGAKKMSAGKRLAGFLLIIGVMIVSFAVPFLVSRSLVGPAPMSEAPEVPDGPGMVGYIILMFLVGLFFLVGGVSGYALTLGTHCFTFNFHKPFWNSFKKKLYVMHIVVTLLIGMGMSAFAAMAITPILEMAGLPWSISFAAPLMGTFILVQLLSIFIDIWQPLGKSTVKRRLTACGVPDEEFANGMCIGISDPAKSSLKKMTMVEEDVGMFWLNENELVYKGDAESFHVSREQFIDTQRAVDAGSMSAYCGNVHVIIRFRTADGTERRVRLHSEGAWTMRGRAKESDSLAEKLIFWKQGINEAIQI